VAFLTAAPADGSPLATPNASKWCNSLSSAQAFAAAEGLAAVVTTDQRSSAAMRVDLPELETAACAAQAQLPYPEQAAAAAEAPAAGLGLTTALLLAAIGAAAGVAGGMRLAKK